MAQTADMLLSFDDDMYTSNSTPRSQSSGYSIARGGNDRRSKLPVVLNGKIATDWNQLANQGTTGVAYPIRKDPRERAHRSLASRTATIKSRTLPTIGEQKRPHYVRPLGHENLNNKRWIPDDNGDLLQMVHQLREENLELSLQVTSLQKENERLTTENDQWKTEGGETISEQSAAIETLKANEYQLESEVNDLRRRLEATRDQVAQAHKINAEMDRIRENEEKSEKELREMRQRFDVWRNDSEMAKRETERLKAENAALRDEVNSWRDREQTMEKKIGEAIMRQSELEARVETETSKQQQTEIEKMRLLNRNEKIRSDLRSLKEKMDRMYKKHEGTTDESSLP